MESIESIRRFIEIRPDRKRGEVGKAGRDGQDSHDDPCPGGNRGKEFGLVGRLGMRRELEKQAARQPGSANPRQEKPKADLDWEVEIRQEGVRGQENEKINPSMEWKGGRLRKGPGH